MNKIKKKTTKMRVNPEDSKKFFWVLLVFVLIIGIWIGVQGANQGMLTLATSAQGLTDQDGAIKVRIRALDASKVNESLYTIDQTAVVKDGQLKLRWQIPGTAKKKAAYIEVCALDKKAGPSAAVKKACIEEAGDVGYNKVSCPYYVPANSTGFSGQLNGWNKLDDSQKVGCSGGRSFSKVSSVKALANAQSPGIEINGGGVLVAKNGKIETKDVEQFVKDALGGSGDTTVQVTTNVPVPGPQGQAGANGAAGAAGIATISGGGLILTGTNLSLDDSCAAGELLKWDGSNWGCAVDGSGSDSQTLSLLANILSISGGNSVNLSGYLDNTDSQALSWISGTRTLSITGGGSVVISDSDTTYSAGNGLSLGGTTFSINSPTCAGTTKLTWNGTAFSCAADVDTDTDTTNFNVAAQGTVGSQNIASGDTVTFNNGTGTTATRSGSTVTYGLNNTAVTAASYAPSDNANGSLALPQFTVDAQGRLTAASTTNVTLTGIANSQLANSAITVNTSGGLSGGSSVSLGGSVNLTIDLSDAADANTATTSSGSGLEVSGSEIGLIRGCATGELLKYNSTSRLWACAADTDTDTDTGVTSVGTIDSQTKSANGAVISGTVLYLQNADASNPGLVSTGTQTFAGDKTFNGNVIADASLTVNGDVVLGNAASDAITFTGEVRGASPLAFEGLTNDGVYATFAITDPTLARTVTFPDRSGTVSLSGDTFTGDVTGTLNSSGATALTIAVNSVALGADTTGDYVTNVTAGGGLTGSATGEGSTPTLAIVSANGGIVVNADDIALTIASSTDALSATTSSGSGLEVLASGLTLIQGCSDTQVLAWNETTDIWACSTPTTAVTTVGTIDSQTKSANGAVISGNTLYLQTADGTNVGLVSTGTQTFAGDKTFSGNVIASGSLTANGDVTLGNAATDALTFTGEIRGASPLAFEGVTNDGVYTTFAITDPTGARTITFPDASGTVCLQASASCAFISTTLADGQILIGNGSNVATAVTPSGDVLISNSGVTAIQANSVALSTDTTGNYVADVTGGTGISIAGTLGEGWTPTINLANTAVTAAAYSAADNANGSIAVPQFTVDAQGRLTAASTVNITPTGIANAQLANSSLTITAGAGLVNGGAVSLGGTVALDIGAGNGITVNTNDITVDLTAATDGLSATTSSSSGLEVLSAGLTLLQGCSDTQLLKWNETTDVWACGSDTDTGVTSIGTIDSQTKSANGAVISGTSLVLQTADATAPGLVSTGTQTFAGNKTFTGNVITNGSLQVDGSTILGDATTDTITAKGSMIANASATATTDTTSGTGTNTTTVTIAGTAFANGDVVLIDNAGQDYYTRVTAGGGTSSLTVSPAVAFETARTVTKYNIQNIGATDSDYTTASNRFFQGYFLGGVVAGAGTTTLSDGRLHSTVGLNFDAPSYTFTNTSDSTSAFRVNKANGENLVKFDTVTTENLLSNGSFEANTTGWAAKGSSTISQTSSQKYLGTGSMSVATTAAANDGAKYDYALASQTQYTMTFYVKNTTLTSSYSTINIGRTEDGTTDSDCATGQTINGAGWSKITCTFTTGNVAGTNHIYLKQTDAIARTMYIDSVELQTSTNIASNPDVEVDTSGWGYYGSIYLSQTTSQFYTGTGSLQADTSTFASYEGPTISAFTAQPNTTYTFSARVMLDAGTSGSKTFSLMKRFDNIDSGSGTSCLSQSLAPGVWTKLTCTFTTAGVADSNPFIAINTIDDGVTPITFYVDNASLSVTKWNSNDIGRISLNGAIDSPLTVRGAQDSTSALQVQQQNGANILTVDTLNGRVGVGTATPTKTLEVNGKILFKDTDTSSNTFQIQNTATSNNVAFNVTASSRAVTVGASTNTANGSLSVYGTQLVKTMTSGGSASAFSVQDSANANVLTVSTTTGNKLVYVGEGGIDAKFQIVNVSSSAVLDIDTATTGSFIAAFDNFHIQNSTGADMIFADGTNNRIIFGDSDDTSSANTALLVVDSASTANLPTGVNGGIVYDTSTSKFKIYEGGAYKTLCNTTDLACAVGDGGVTSIGTIDSQTKSANGAVISGTSLVMQNADATYPGLVSTGTQTFAGDKAFNGGVTIGAVGTPSGQLFVSGSVPSAAAGSVSGGTNPYRLHVQGSYAYVVDEGGNALKIYDITNPASPTLVSSVATGTAPYDVFVKGSQAYVINRTSATLQVFDVSNPASPTAIGSVAAQGATPEEVEIYGNYAYVSSSGTSAVETYDISDPKNPLFLANVYSGSPAGTFVQGKYLYIIDIGTDTLEIYDISKPDIAYLGATFVGSVSTGAASNPSSIFVQGKYAYITHEGADTLGVYNITDPTAPASVGTVSTGTGPKSVYVQGRYAYVANTSGNTLQTIDVSNPVSPTSEGTVAASGANSVSVKGRYAYVAQSGSNTLDVYDVGGAYIQQLETGGIKTGSLDVSQALNVDGALTVNGASKITGDLQVQDSTGAAGLLVDTTKREVSLSTGWSGDLMEDVTGNYAFTVGTEPASVVVNGYMYMVGGGTTVEYGKIMADGSVPSVSATTSLPASKTRLAAVAHNGYMYAIGGGTSNTVYFSRINADGTLGSWKSTTSLTTSGTNHSAAIYKGNLYVVSSGSGNPVIHAKINPDGTVGSWTTSSMTGGTRPSIVVVNSKLYEFNGQSTDTVQYADIGSDGTLSGVTTGSFDLPIPVYKTRPLFMNGYLYAFTDDLSIPQMYYAKVNSDGTIGSWNTTSTTLWSSGSGSYNSPISAYNGYVYAAGEKFYTSGRTLVGGTLDLTSLGRQDMNSGAGVGASLNAGNTNIVGSLDVVGQTSLMQGLSVAGDVNVAGQAVFQNTTDSTSAFRVQTSGGNSIVSIDTATTPNLITNPSFELNTDGWAARTSATLTKNTTEKYVGTSSMQVVTGAAANNGTKYNYALASSTTYSLSFYAKSGGTFTTMQVGRTDNGTTGSETNCLTGQAVSTTNWTRYTCTFTTGTTSGTPYIYIKQSDAAAHTYYVDGVQLEAASASTNFKLGGIAIDGVLTSHLTMQNSVNSTGAFGIQNAAGTTLLGVDTINGKLFSTIADGASAVGLTFNTPSYTTSGAKLVSFQNNGTEKTYIDKDGNIDTTGGIQTGASSILGDATTDTLTSNGSIIANSSATATTDTTSGTGTNTTTVTIVGTAFANGDVIFIDNAGQDYYTRVTAGGGTSSLTVSPAVSFDNAITVTKYNVQNVGATSTDYTTAANRFFQGYFLGGVVTGSGSTTLSDGLVSSTGGTLNLYGGGADGASAVGLIVNTPSYTTSGAKLVAFQNNGVEKFYVDKDGNVDLASGAAYKINGSDICTSSGCAILATSGIQNQIGSDQTGDFRISGTGRANTSLQTPLLDTATATTLNIGTNNATDISLNKATTIASGLNFNALGKSKFKDATSEHDAFQVQNTSGDVLLNIGNAGYNPADTNLITNSNFENGGGVSWTNKNGGSVGGGGTNGAYSGSWWMTSYNTGVDDGTKYDVTLSPSTTYTFSAYVRMPSGSMSTLVLGRQDQSGTDIDCATSPSFADTDDWVRVSCVFTTGGTISNSNVYIKQSDASSRTIYVDAAMLQARGYLSTYTMGDNFFAAPLTRGLIISGGYTQKALDVQSIYGTSLFNVDSSTNVIGAGTTMNFLAPGYVFKNTADSGSAFTVQKSNGTSIFNVNTSSDRIEFTSYNTSSGLAQSSVADGASAKAFTFDTASAYSTSGAKLLSLQNNSVEKFSVDKDGNVDLASGAVYKINGTPGASTTCSGGQILLDPVLLGGLTTSGTCTSGAVTSIGTIDSQTKSANGAVISGNTLVLQNADATYPGLVSTGTQTFAGDKTFNGGVTIGTAGTPTGQLYVSGSVPAAASGSVATATAPVSMYVQGKYAYVANMTSATLTVYDISNPASPTSMGSVATDTSPRGVYVQGKYAYVTNYTSATLTVYDISNPVSPTSVGSVATGNGPYNVHVQGKYAYVTNYTDSTLDVYDISNPASPSSVGSVATGASPLGINVQGKYAYVTASGSTTMESYDISNPVSPTSVGSVMTGTSPQGIYVQGKYAYVTNTGSGSTSIVNISNPASMSVISSPSTTNPRSVYVQGKYAYVANGTANTIQVLDISNPASVTSVGTMSTNAIARGVFVQGRYAYAISQTGATLQVYDVGGSYLQQLEAGGIETSTLSSLGNVSFGNNADIQGGLTVAGNTQFNADLGVSGKVSFQNVGTTTTAFTLTANSLTSGNGLAVENTGTGLTGNLFSVTSGSTSALTNGVVRYNFTGAHTGNGVQIDDVTTTGTVYKMNANSLTSGNGLVIANTGTGLTGNLFSVTSGSTSALTNGVVRYNFTGAHTGVGVQIDDATASGTVYKINASALTTGTAFQVTGPSGKNFLRILYEATDPLDTQRVIIGGGGISASKPDSLARDQLYVFGRINYSWNMFTQDFLTGNPAVAADGLFMNGYYDENIGTGGTSPSGSIAMQNTTGASGMARLTFTGTLGTGPWASNWGTGGNLVTERSLNPVFEARVQASSNTDVRHIVGFTDMALNATTSADTNNSANEVFFRKTAAGTNWEAVSRNGSGTEEVTTLATACAGSTACTTTALRTMRIELENVGANGTARFYIDGTLVATHTSTAVPANTNRLGWLLTNTPTTTTYSGRTLDMDYVRVWSDDPPSSIAPGDVGQNDGVEGNTNITENGDTPTPEDNSNEALLGRIKTLEEDVSDLNQYKDVLTTEAIGESSLKKAIFIADVEFRKQVEFSADALFKANVNVDGTLNANGRVVVSNNTGTITIQPGQTEIQVLFAKSLQGKPNVFLSTENPDVKVVAQTRTKDGFVIKLSEPITEPLDVQWFAVEKE